MHAPQPEGRRNTDIAPWLGIPDIMVVAKNERSRWLDIRCSYWRPVGPEMREAYMFRVSMPTPDDLIYQIEIQWDDGTEHVMGATMDDSIAKRNQVKTALNQITATQIVHELMDPKNVQIYKAHLDKGMCIHNQLPSLTAAVDLLIELLNIAIGVEMDKQLVHGAMDEANDAHINRDVAHTLTTIRVYMDKVFRLVAYGDDYRITKTRPVVDYAIGIANAHQAAFNDVAMHSHYSPSHQNWVYENLRHQLRQHLQRIYRECTGHTG